MPSSRPRSKSRASNRPDRCAFSEGGRRCIRNAAAGTNPPLCNTHVVVVAGMGRPQQGSKVAEVIDNFLSGGRVTREQLEDAANEIFGSWGIGGNIAGGYYPPADGQGAGQQRGARGGPASPGFRPPFGFRPPPGWPFGQQAEPEEDPQFAELEAKVKQARVVLGFAATEPIDRDKLKKRYRELAMRHHPDRPGGDRTKMEQINAAKDLIESLME